MILRNEFEMRKSTVEHKWQKVELQR